MICCPSADRPPPLDPLLAVALAICLALGMLTARHLPGPARLDDVAPWGRRP